MNNQNEETRDCRSVYCFSGGSVLIILLSAIIGTLAAYSAGQGIANGRSAASVAISAMVALSSVVGVIQEIRHSRCCACCPDCDEHEGSEDVK